jgi:hypothetical protein
MIADIVVDFTSHLKHGNVFLVELDLPIQDHPDDVPSHISVELYLIAHDCEQAQYIAHTMYPDAEGISVHIDPIDEFTYVSRRNRSILQGT